MERRTPDSNVLSRMIRPRLWSRIEEARCSDLDLRAAFAANDVGMSAVTNDHAVVGFSNMPTFRPACRRFSNNWCR
jgi:hypothetical protein